MFTPFFYLLKAKGLEVSLTGRPKPIHRRWTRAGHRPEVRRPKTSPRRSFGRHRSEPPLPLGWIAPIVGL